MQNPNEFKNNIVFKIKNKDNNTLIIRESDPVMELSQADLEKLFDDPGVRDSLVNSQQYISQNICSQQDNSKNKISHSKFFSEDKCFSKISYINSQIKSKDISPQQILNEDPFEGMTEQDFQNLIKDGIDANH
jgi:hypothetical protein